VKQIAKSDRWFSFKGIKNTAMHVAMTSMPTRPLPAAKGDLLTVPGMNGKLWQPENAFDRINVSLALYTEDNADIDEVCAWLSGEGDLVFGDEPDKAYHARITKEFSRNNQNARFYNQTMTPSFDCEPFRYESNPADPISITTSGTAITNIGTIASAPLLVVSGSGTGTLMVGSSSMIFTGMTGDITIDCDAKFAYTGSGTTRVLATQYITGDWIEIGTGTQYVTFSGGITGVTITPNWRWL
jgi:predicted phage tail component-like protein